MNALAVGLTAVVVAVRAGGAQVLTVTGADTRELPSGPFEPDRHRTLELALRSYVSGQAGLTLGYVEQLYTFGNRHRGALGRNREITIGYLALVGPEAVGSQPGAAWCPYYRLFPWEDRRPGASSGLDPALRGALEEWCAQAGTEREDRQARVVQAFGGAQFPWDPERVILRYELLYEAGLVAESHRDWASYPREERDQLPIRQRRMDDPALRALAEDHCVSGEALGQDHRRILASSLSRLRGKLKYRPVIFELVPEEFTLLQIQKVAEALSGQALHKGNFRRLLVQGGLVKPTEAKDLSGGGRPAALYRFRRSVTLERPAPGLRLPTVPRG